MNTRRNIAVAIVDDDQLFADFVGLNLDAEPGIRVLKMSSEIELDDALAQSRLDCVILDFDLGCDNGLVIAQRLKAKFATPPPIIMLTGVGSERMAVKAFRSGFSDYVSKRNLNLGELITAVREAVAHWDAETSQRSEIQQLKLQLTHDPVTGMLSASSIAAKLDRLTREQHPFVALRVDIAGLSDISSRVGHAATENVVRRFAERVKQAAARDDLAGKSLDNSFVYIVEKQLDDFQIEALKASLSAALTFSLVLDSATIRLSPEISKYVHKDESDQRSGLSVLQDHLASTENVATSDSSPYSAAAEISTSLRPKVEAAKHSRVDERENNRTERRQRVLKRAKIVDAGLNISIDCTVRDISSKGVRLRLESYFAPPDLFKLMIVGSGTVQPVKLAWQIGDELGVQFVGPAVPI